MLKKSDKSHKELAYWCVVSGSAVWLIDDNLPFGEASDVGLSIESSLIIGEHLGYPVRWLNEEQLDQSLPLTSLKALITWPEPLFLLVSKAIQYGHMLQSMRFCPQCGARNHLNHNQIAMQCGECRTLHYPRIFPCIIIAVRKEQQILLAQHARHKTGMYTVIAGFVEVGETLEACAKREVKEETGIDIDNIRYFGSQPWAFPSSLMVGFMADYAGGTLKPDEYELTEAQWFPVDNLPDVAPVGTIARALIEQVRKEVESA
ncbi:NADH pyrophosphatase [Vibrio sp. 10N.286.49.B3]|uniref:NAD(+) diphosphatase n=1 Tax=Vibrio sp. 10N.286.49.B3 TaxID=1880855 RepID=UPI000C816BEB|nr:NAD(+) diphosphatase [Vibrio sp. 10N.286.49.B3]PMH46214.1 NADH pyrophosphatase [Vibrio sp. 10N.286.49.B3]